MMCASSGERLVTTAGGSAETVARRWAISGPQTFTGIGGRAAAVDVWARDPDPSLASCATATTAPMASRATTLSATRVVLRRWCGLVATAVGGVVG